MLAAATIGGSAEPPLRQYVAWILWLALLIRVGGLGIEYLWGQFETESPLYETLLFDLHFPERLAIVCEDTLLWLYLFITIATGWLWWRTAPHAECHGRRLLRWLLSIAALIEICLATTATYRGGWYMSSWTPITHALRYGLPVAVYWAIVYRSADSVPRRSRLESFLRLATSAVFFGHGVEAIRKAPAFVTLLVGTAENCVGGQLTQQTAERLLLIIGFIDCALAIAVLVGRWWSIAFYMAVWGLVTALSRITAGGWGNSYEAMLRAGHVAGPLVLFLLWRSRRPEQARNL